MTDTKMGAKVRALLDTADSYEAEGNLEAASTYRTKAEELMVKYRLEQEDTLAVDPGAARPIQVDIDLVGNASKYKNHYYSMWYYIAKHCGIRTHLEWKYTDAGYVVRAYAVGYEDDIRYAEMLFTSARLVFTERLEPKVKPELSDQVNAYRLRSAGLERIRVAEMLWGNTDKVFMGRVGRLYKAECEERGEPAHLSGRGVTGKAYREQYADSFVTTFTGRLWQAQQSAGAGGGLVLHGREERVTEAYYAFYPDRRPKAEVEAATEEPECAKCAKAKTQCREHKISYGRSSAGPDYNSVAAQRGRMAGSAAAREVGIRGSAATPQVGG
jgi:hypothetical protein